MNAATPVHAWHFTAATSLANGDKRQIKLGETLSVAGKIVPCKHGLHASVSAYDALTYAPGPILWRVELSGTVVAHGDPVDKYAASQRTVIAGGIDVSPALREYGRWCALQVIHLWDAPAVVREYLETGNEDLRDAARDAAGAAAWDAAGAAASAAAGAAAWDAARAAASAAAWDAARDAAWDAARDAASAAWNAAWDAARDAASAAWNAAWDAARDAAWNAAWDAAGAAAWAAQRARFEEICLQLVGETTP